MQNINTINFGSLLVKKLFKQPETAPFIFANVLKCRYFPNFPLKFFGLQMKDQNNSIFGNIFFLSVNYFLQRHATHVCFHISLLVIIHHQKVPRGAKPGKYRALRLLVETILGGAISSLQPDRFLEALSSAELMFYISKAFG